MASRSGGDHETGTGRDAGEERPARGKLADALLPIAAGVLLDLVDLATFGPLGLSGGFVVGGLVGALLCHLEGIGGRKRLALIAIAALYTAMPFTEMLPLATLMAILTRFAADR